MLQYVWFASYMKKKVTIVAPSREVKEDLLLLLMRIEGCEQAWFNIITADELDKKWFIAAVPTTHVKPLEGKCFGYHLNIHGNNVVYTGDTATLEPFKPLLKNGSFLYTEAAFCKSEVHLYLKDMLPEFIRLLDGGVHVYLIRFAKLGIFTLKLCNTQFCFVIGHLILLSFGSGISLASPV